MDSHHGFPSLLTHLPRPDPRLLVGPQIGEDAAVIDTGDRCLVVSTDWNFARAWLLAEMSGKNPAQSV